MRFVLSFIKVLKMSRLLRQDQDHFSCPRGASRPRPRSRDYISEKYCAQKCSSRLIDWVKALRPTQHKIGHFGDVPQSNLLAWYGKKLNLLKPGLAASHDIWHGNREGLFLFCCFINLSLRHLPTYLQPGNPLAASVPQQSGVTKQRQQANPHSHGKWML